MSWLGVNEYFKALVRGIDFGSPSLLGASRRFSFRPSANAIYISKKKSRQSEVAHINYRK